MKLLKKLRARYSALRYMPSRARKHYNAFNKVLARLSNLRPDYSEAKLKVLDLGCGYYAPHTLLFHNMSQPVTGIDVVNVFRQDGMKALYRDIRKDGQPFHKAAFLTLERNMAARPYYKELNRLAAKELSGEKVELYSYDGCNFPFPDESYDCIVSQAVLEHVMDLEKMAQECARILRPGGVMDMIWHNYYSFSGNHLPVYRNRRHPWGHLTGDIKDIPKTLNRATPEQIEKAFASSLKVTRVVGVSWDHCIKGEDDGFQYKAEELLDDKLYQRLEQYPRELLLTVSYLIQAVKR